MAKGPKSSKRLNTNDVTAGLPAVPSISGGARPQVSTARAGSLISQGGNGMSQGGSNTCKGSKPL